MINDNEIITAITWTIVDGKRVYDFEGMKEDFLFDLEMIKDGDE